MENYNAEQDILFTQARQTLSSSKKEQEDSKNNNFPPREFEDVKYLGLNPDIEAIFRIVSMPVGIPSPKNTDCTVVLQSRILSDDGSKYVKINWPVTMNRGKHAPDKNWILTELYNKIREGEFKKLTKEDVDNVFVFEKDGKFINKNGKDVKFVYKHKTTPSFLKIENNRKPKDQYPPKFWPETKVLMNVIDRKDTWCLDNKHTKVLSTKVNETSYKQDDGSSKNVVFADSGISFSMYEDIFNSFHYRSNWDIDCIVKRFKGSTKWTYTINDANDAKKLSQDVVKFLVEGNISENELKYEKYDFKKLYPVSSYNKIAKYFIDLFKQVDLDFKTNFTERLKELVIEENNKNREKEEKAAEKEDVNEDACSNSEEFETTNQELENSQEEVKIEEAKEATRPVRTVAKETEANSISTQLSQTFKNWDTFDKLDKEDILKDIESIENGVIIWKKSAKIVPCDNKQCLYPDTNVRPEYPQTVQHCLVCGIKFS